MVLCEKGDNVMVHACIEHIQPGEIVVLAQPESQAGFGIRDSGFGVRDSEFGIRGSGFGIRDSGFGIRDSGFGIRDSGLYKWKTGFLF